MWEKTVVVRARKCRRETNAQKLKKLLPETTQKHLYKFIKDISGSNCNNENLPIKNLQGTILQSEDKQNKRWVEYFCTVSP